jgi:hypothetical protein
VYKDSEDGRRSMFVSFRPSWAAAATGLGNRGSAGSPGHKRSGRTKTAAREGLGRRLSILAPVLFAGLALQTSSLAAKMALRQGEVAHDAHHPAESARVRCARAVCERFHPSAGCWPSLSSRVPRRVRSPTMPDAKTSAVVLAADRAACAQAPPAAVSQPLLRMRFDG